VPVSLNFTDENKTLLVGTNYRNQYKIDLMDLKVKNIALDSDKINCKLWNIRYPQKQKKF
jgi:hypothetical protein